MSTHTSYVYLNVNEEGEVYDIHLTREEAEAVQRDFPNDSISVRLLADRF